MPCVTFSDVLVVYSVPSQADEDRKGMWMQLAIDRQHFQSRIEKCGKVITPMLEYKLDIMKSSLSLQNKLNMYPFNSPTTMVLSGCTQSGKTTWVKRLLLQLSHMFPENPPSRVLYCYAIYQEAFTEMQGMEEHLEFHEGLPSSEFIDNFRETGHHCVIVLDDMMEQISKSRDVQNLFTRGSHHQNITVIYINQNFYCEGSCSRTINRNAHYIVLFECADLLQIEIFGKQMGMCKPLVNAYMDAVSEDYGYLVVDRSPSRNRLHQLRTKVFKEDTTIVYVPK